MDSTSRLDYALFQLTPTRTRFDLVLFYGGNSEKLASGLFEPFISHLKFARDEISKGGYSITLRPPSHAAPWFTKATFERFVRFVSTPAVLERFVSIEKEIVQIEVSIHANESSNTDEPGQLDQGSGSVANGLTRKSTESSKLKSELERANDSIHEENSRIQLQRLLETRRVLLRKEQAMAYARGLVAGFQMDNIDDLISFAYAYGASRLREACVNFKELCKKKHGDGLWMEELAAMEACSPAELSFLGTSGIVLMNEASGPNQNVLLNFTNLCGDASKDSTASNASSDGKKDDNLPASVSKVQIPVTWQNQLPPYMYSFQGPIHQLPPYQGYPFSPPMHPHYAGNMQWPPNMRANYHNNQKSSLRKEEFLNRKDYESGEDRRTESSDSDIESDSDSNIQQDNKNSSTEHSNKKKHRKKSSKTVVIRNINYITPERRNGEKGGDSDESSSEEDEFLDEESLRKKVDDAVGLLKKSRKANSSCHKKIDANKSVHVANGSNDAIDQDSGGNSVEHSSKKGKGKGKDNWDAFQNLLMRVEEKTDDRVETLCSMDVQDEHLILRSSEGGISSTTTPAVDQESEKDLKKHIIATDSFVVTDREGGSEGRVKLEDFENGENFRSVLKSEDCTDADLLFSRRSEEPVLGIGDTVSTCASESSTIKTVMCEDCFIVNHSGKKENEKGTNGQTIFDGDCVLPVGDNLHGEKHKKDVLIDDSLMIQARSVTDDLYEPQWKMDIRMDVDLTSAASPGDGAANGSQDKHEVYEPNDLCMVLERESEFQSSKDSWSMDYGIDVSFEEANKRCSVAEVKLSDDNLVKNNEVNGTKHQGKEARSKVPHGSIRKSKPELMSKSRKPSLVSRPGVQKSKLEKEEEIRKKMEELLIQRQKRIAERTAANGLAPTASKKAPSQSRTAKGPIKSDTNNIPAATRETNRIGCVKIRAT